MADDDRPAPADEEPLELEPRGNQPAALASEAACISVDAGAGTGKTTTMLMRIEQAIERDGVDPGDVLVLTFANEAAASIREAVRERLGPTTAAEIDVYTYHSLCHRLVREYAYAIGLSPEFDVVTGRGRRRIVQRLLAENDYDFAATGGDGSVDDLAGEIDGFVRTMSQEGIDPDDLEASLPDVRTLELLAGFVRRLERQADETLSFDNEALRYFDGADHLETAREALVEYGTLLTFCREQIAEAPPEYRDDPVVADLERYLAVLQECVTNVHEALSPAEPTTKHLPRALFCNRIAGEATERLEQTPIGRLASYVEYLRLARHYTDVYADYRATLEREGTVDFDALVRTATELLAGAEVADEIADRWDRVYCDEFQDTDGTQFELVRRLTAGSDRPDLFAIGDKDQSIYGWRGTDREGLDRLAEVYDDHESVALELNFRSKQEILDLTNECAYDFESPKTLREVGRTPGEYDEPEPPLRVGKVESDAIDSRPAQQVATTVSRLLNGDLEDVPRRSLSDVAVIVRTNRHARAVAEALRERQLPHEVSGSAGGELSPGIRTVVSYLRVLVEPEADVHLRRVLLYRYRVPRADLERLGERPGSLYEALSSFDPAGEFAAPDALERAREHLEELETVREVSPLGGFVRRFRELTRIEWFLASGERSDLERIERFAESYDPGSVLSTLSPAFVDALERALVGGRSGYDRGSQSEDCVDVMTVHQAKGLEFDTVLVPYLSDEEWCVEHDYTSRARDRLLAATIDDDVDSPLLADLAAEAVGEEWRVLHVALTRAENHLFLFGSSYDYEGEDDQLAVSTADACLAEAIEWDVAGRRMDLWDRLTESFERVRTRYPETVADRTDEIASSTAATPGTITYYEGYGDRPVEPLETRAAIETVHRLGRLLRTGTLLPAADAAPYVEEVQVPTGRSASALSPETTRFPVETLSSASDLPVTIRHSYSAVRTHGECPRKHYLDHVVDAVPDPLERDGKSDARVVGRLFHAVAEEAFHREYTDREAWLEAADRQVTARDLTDGRVAVRDCVDRYFAATAPDEEGPVHAWPALAAELPFALEDVDGVGGEVVGYVDSVRRTPDGELVVLDYKTTGERIDPAEAVQLRLYLRACRDRFDEPVSRAGYVYVGEAGPAVELFGRDELPSWSSVRARLAAVDDPSFAETEPGEHCRFCAHRSLGCGPAEYAVDDAD